MVELYGEDVDGNAAAMTTAIDPPQVAWMRESTRSALVGMDPQRGCRAKRTLVDSLLFL